MAIMCKRGGMDEMIENDYQKDCHANVSEDALKQTQIDEKQ